MIDGLKVSNKWAPISGSPIVNVSRVCPCLGFFFRSAKKYSNFWQKTPGFLKKELQ